MRKTVHMATTQQLGRNRAENSAIKASEIRMSAAANYHTQNALNEHEQHIRDWFETAKRMGLKYNISSHDVYSFGEMAFKMGPVTAAKVVTGPELLAVKSVAKPGSQRWATVHHGVNAKGWALPCFIVLAGKHHLEGWYSPNNGLPDNWLVALSNNGLTTEEHYMQWIHHFEKETKDRKSGKYRMLIMDSLMDGYPLQFAEFCRANNIIMLFMPSSISHLLQPFNVGCLSPLKQAYGEAISNLGRQRITPFEFIHSFTMAFDQSVTEKNIKAGIRDTGLLPLNRNVVLSLLGARSQSSEPPLPELVTAETELDLLKRQLEKKDKELQKTAASIFEIVAVMQKANEMMAESMAILHVELAKRRQHDKAELRDRQRKRPEIHNDLDLVNQYPVRAPLRESNSGNARTGAGVGKTRRCGRCRQPGHRVETCSVDRLATKH
jgi:hypothetical protein